MMTGQELSWVRSHSDAEDEWQRRQHDPIQQVDFAIHNHYLRQYLKSDMRVLEMGAGSGRFTQEIAAISARVVVADMSADKLALNRRNAEAQGYARQIEAWRECNMIDLSHAFDDDEFDAVVCVGGPLSYVFDRRERAVRELYRVTRSGGLLLLSARSLFGTLHQDLPRILNVDRGLNREIVSTGDVGPASVAAVSRFWHAYRADEFRQFVTQTGAQPLVMSASNCLSATWGDLVATWLGDQRTWQQLIELELEACREPGCLDMGAHILLVAQKP